MHGTAGLTRTATRSGPRTGTGYGRRAGAWPLRAADAFFLHVQTPAVAQQIGVVLELGPPAGRGPLSVADLTALLARRLGGVPMLRRRFVARGRLRRPGWMLEPEVDPAAQVRGHRLPAGATAAEAAVVIDEFWSQPLPPDRPPWQIMLVSGLPASRVLLAIKLHHALGDGLSAIGALRRLLDDRPPARLDARPRARLDACPPARRGRGGSLARGLIRLARVGRAPRLPINRPIVDARRRVLFTTLASADVTRVAAALGVRASELILGLVAEALHRTVPPEGAPGTARAIVPVSVRPRRQGSTHGNWTGAVALDLPIGRMPVAARVRAAREALRQNVAAGEPDAASLVMRLMGALPAPAHRRLARTVYTSRFFNIIVSHLPGTGRASTLAGAPILAAYPVVALADGVGIGVGAMRWADRTGVGVIVDRSLAGTGTAFVAAFNAAFDSLAVGSELR
ncbi:DUF1298 domain-containing protein [Planosporangium thailandense]|uniref:diacylglycerol O-acyltransferase n=1 Tax=Planosporangium thailandense TaxID=765197 RepID=A0ABX0Y160_9ACTN|nr:wax ester/triacylglycerol synthase domain-containing protein [Planosporangium thailandense]NJC71184.1 DUF1298 domain-containing protein [Planosporangium thailandense]